MKKENTDKPKRVYIRKPKDGGAIEKRIEEAAAKASGEKKKLPVWWDEQAVIQAENRRKMYNVAMANSALHIRRHNIKEG